MWEEVLLMKPSSDCLILETFICSKDVHIPVDFSRAAFMVSRKTKTVSSTALCGASYVTHQRACGRDTPPRYPTHTGEQDHALTSALPSRGFCDIRLSHSRLLPTSSGLTLRVGVEQKKKKKKKKSARQLRDAQTTREGVTKKKRRDIRRSSHRDQRCRCSPWPRGPRRGRRTPTGVSWALRGLRARAVRTARRRAPHAPRVR